MNRFVIVILAGAVLTGAALANGGPYDGSRVISAGGPQFTRVERVDLLSEDLSFVVDGNFVDVEVTYVLRNTGHALRVDFAFPVDFVTTYTDLSWTEEDDLDSTEVAGFTVLLDGEDLPLRRFGTADSAGIVLDGYPEPVQTSWFASTLELASGSVDTLRVSYRFKPFFEDSWYSKSWLPDCSPMQFAYRLDPAGGWGGGTVGRFSWSIDFSMLLGVYGRIDDLPARGGWISPTVYGWSGTDVDLRNAAPLHFEYGMYSWKLLQFIADFRFKTEDIDAIRASSSLAPQGGCTYGPENLLDGDMNTAWCEGDTGSGVGSWIEVDLDSSLVGAIFLIDGYMKSEEAYGANSRIRSLMLILENDPDNPYAYGSDSILVDQVVELDDMQWRHIDSSNYAAQMQPLFVTADPGEPVRRIRIEVRDVYPGTAYSDLCATELVVVGYDREDLRSWLYPD